GALQVEQPRMSVGGEEDGTGLRIDRLQEGIGVTAQVSRDVPLVLAPGEIRVDHDAVRVGPDPDELVEVRNEVWIVRQRRGDEVQQQSADQQLGASPHRSDVARQAAGEDEKKGQDGEREPVSDLEVEDERQIPAEEKNRARQEPLVATEVEPPETAQVSAQRQEQQELGC